MIEAGRRSKCRSMSAWIAASSIRAGPERVDAEADRPGDPDAVGDLDLEAVGEARGDDVLGHPAGGVRRRAVDLGRILAARRRRRRGGPSRRSVSTMILRPVRPASPIGPPVTKRPVGLTCMTGSVSRSSRRDRRQDDRLDDLRAEPLGADVRVVLGRHDDGPDPLRDAALVLDRDLGLAVGPEVRQLAGLADLGQPARHPVGERDRQRHQLGRLAAGEPEHHPLVAGAELERRRGVVADLERGIDALGDVGRLLLDRDERAAGQVVEAVVGPGVADVADGVADDRLEVDVGRAS